MKPAERCESIVELAPLRGPRANNTVEISVREFRAILDELEGIIAGYSILWEGIERDVPAWLEIIGAGISVDALVAEYPYLQREDIMQALRYAAWRAEEREVMLADA